MHEPVSSYYMQTGKKQAVQVWIDREKLPNGAVFCSLICETGETLGSWWEEAPKKQRRGSTSRYCIGKDFDSLTAEQGLALLRIRRQVLNDGRIKSRRRHRQGRQAELAGLLGTEGMLRSLREAGAIYEKDERFYVDRRFLFRG